MKTKDKFRQLMKNSGFSAPEDIIANRKIHLFKDGNNKCYYILSVNKPAVGYFGCFNLDTLVEIGNKPLNDSSLQELRRKKADKMQDRIKQAKSRYIAKKEQSSDTEKTISDSKAVERLSALSIFDYDRVRKEEANKLNIRVNTLDDVVAKKRKKDASIKLHGHQLLSDIHAIFVGLNVECIRIESLINALCSDKSKIWTTFNRGKPITSNQLAGILKKCGVKSQEKGTGSSAYLGYRKKSISQAINCDSASSRQ